jgi:ABC-type branched-subunit amino acid transport system permease subunit
VFGFLFGLPALRLEGIYLALATFALAIAIPQVLKSSVVEHWTGGVQGIVIIKPDAPFGLPLTSDQWLISSPVADGDRDVCLRRQSGEEPHRPRADRDPRSSGRRRARWASTCRSTSR